jgi:hypothetical protein
VQEFSFINTTTRNNAIRAMAPSINLTTTSCNNNTSFRNGHRIILRNDGRNIVAWKALLPVYLRSAKFAWDTITGDLNPILDPANRENYEIGNQKAREIIFSTLCPELMLTLFYDDFATVTGKDAWDRINSRYVGSRDILAHVAASKLTGH